MVRFYTQNYSYDYPFPTVTLAYFLRYPNPFSTHVLSTDVIERTFDAETQRLHTTRLHLKASKAPAAVLKLIPRSFVGASASGDSQSYVLERSTVDVKEGWMKTESRNLDWTGVLSVVERQTYRAAGANASSSIASSSTTIKPTLDALAFGKDESTDVITTVTLYSRLGQRFKRQRQTEDIEEEAQPKVGFFRSWSNAGLQRSIEAIGLRSTSKKQPNATEGMKVVLERLRSGGLVRVLEGMRQDREQAMQKHKLSQ